MTATTVPTVGLVIHPTFDSSITNDPNAAAIQATINRAISIYETLFTDPITIEIRFRYATALPDGTSLSGDFLCLSRSSTGLIGTFWINALRADATSSNDNIAIASLPANSLLGDAIVAASANGRALGQNTPPAMFADGTVGTGGPYDAVVTLNWRACFSSVGLPVPTGLTRNVQSSKKLTTSWAFSTARAISCLLICSVGHRPARGTSIFSVGAIFRSTVALLTSSISIRTQAGLLLAG